MAGSESIVAGSQFAAGTADAYGQYRSGKFNARIHRMNAEIAEMQARDAARRGESAVAAARGEGKRVLAAQRASYAGQGVAVDQDVAAVVASDTERAIEQDVDLIRANAIREAWGHRVQAVDSRARASVERYESNNRASGTILTSGIESYRTYRNLKA